MNTALALNQNDDPVPGERRLVLTGISWEGYETIHAALDGHPGVRLYYLNGDLEIMTPLPAHEFVKTNIGRLIERYAEERGIQLLGYGSTTFKVQAMARGLEPDECYVIDTLREVPDIAIEVVLTSGGIDKLEIYRGLGVPEVWFWRSGAFAVYRLHEDTYERLERSRFLPDLDLALLAEYVSWPDQLKAVRAFVAGLRK